MGDIAGHKLVPVRVSCEIVASSDRLRQLESDWHRLWEAGERNIFQSYHWVEAWWSTRTTASHLFIALAWDEQKLVAILPFAIRRWSGTRILEWAAQSVSDYCDAIAEHPEIVRLLWREVRRAGGFDIIRLKNVHPDSLISRALADVMECRQEIGEVCLNLTSDWTDGDHWFRNLNKKKRNNWSRGKRMLSQDARLDFRQSTQTPEPQLLEQLVAMKRASMAANGIKSSSDVATLTELTRALEKIQALRVFLVTRDESVVAASINAVQGKALLAYFAVYDAAFARASPGILLMTEYTRWAFDSGLTKVDYLRGEEGFKFEFANGAVQLNSYIEAETYWGHAALTLHQLWQSLYRLVASRRMPNHPEIGSAYATKAGNLRNTPARSGASPVTETID